jgi:heptosyltransferase-1
MSEYYNDVIAKNHFCKTKSSKFMKILIIKLSSLGDVLHSLPVVWDIRARHPHAQIDWVIEESFAGLLEPLKTIDSFKGIDRVIPINLRRWKKVLKNGEFIRSIQEFLGFKNELQQTSYDLVIDIQGLIKSAALSKLAKISSGGGVIGPANKTQFSGFEPLARRFYTEAVQVPFHLHAVERARWVVASAIDAPAPKEGQDLPKFYPDAYVNQLENQSQALAQELAVQKPYAVFLHATSRADKRWPNASWVTVGRYLTEKGVTVVLPWGSADEKKISLELSQKIPNSIVPRALSIHEIHALIAGAQQIIGVDTGLVHVSAAFGKPTIEIYCNSWKGNAQGYWSPQIHNLGDMGQIPSVEDVIAYLN